MLSLNNGIHIQTNESSIKTVCGNHNNNNTNGGGCGDSDEDEQNERKLPAGIDALALSVNGEDEGKARSAPQQEAIHLANGSTTKEQQASIAYKYPAAPPLYPARTPVLHSSPIEVLSTEGKGRGVFAKQDIPAGTLIDISPVLLLSNEEYYGGGKEGQGKGVEGSVLRGYVFTWKGKEGGMALALGLGSLFNHSPSPNVSFELQTSSYTIQYKTFSSVKAGDELCIFYGHKTRFEGDEERDSSNNSSSGADDDSDTLWGGLGGIDAEANERRRLKVKKRWDDEIVPFTQLEWDKITNMIDPEDRPLVTMDCWVMDIPARYVQHAFQWMRKRGSMSVDSSSAFDDLSHLKRVRNHPHDPDRDSGLIPGPGTPLGDRNVFVAPNGSQRHLTGPDSLVTVLLLPTSTAPADLQDQISDWATSVGITQTPKIYVVTVPSAIARTDQQAREWGRLWPVQMVHIREGPRARPRAQGWERAKQQWVRREAERVWLAALDAHKRGENPIACHVTDTYNPDVHSASNLPKTLVRAHDTRRSTDNCLSHAASNAIDAVAVLDRQNLRGPALLPDLPPPYLLTGQTVFMSHEPCLLCSMSLLHSRIAQLFYIKKSPGSGGCGSVYSVHEDGGLNHRFEVWQWRGGEGMGEGLDVMLDT